MTEFAEAATGENDSILTYSRPIIAVLDSHDIGDNWLNFSKPVEPSQFYFFPIRITESRDGELVAIWCDENEWCRNYFNSHASSFLRRQSLYRMSLLADMVEFEEAVGRLESVDRRTATEENYTELLREIEELRRAIIKSRTGAFQYQLRVFSEDARNQLPGTVANALIRETSGAFSTFLIETDAQLSRLDDLEDHARADFTDHKDRFWANWEFWLNIGTLLIAIAALVAAGPVGWREWQHGRRSKRHRK